MDDFDSRRKLLTEALRSGMYSQARYALRTADGFCCLGVACNIYMKETGIGSWQLDGDLIDERFEFWKFVDGSGLESSGTMPDEVRNWFGFITERGDFSLGAPFCLASMNDMGSSFDEIADTIDSRLELFIS